MDLTVGKMGSLMAASTSSLGTHENRLPPFGGWGQATIPLAIGVGGWLQRLQVGEQVGNILFAWFFPEHRRGNTLAHGGVQILLPTVPGPGSRLFDSIEGQDGFKGEGGAIIKGIHAFRVNTTFIVT